MRLEVGCAGDGDKRGAVDSECAGAAREAAFELRLNGDADSFFSGPGAAGFAFLFVHVEKDSHTKAYIVQFLNIAFCFCMPNMCLK